MPGKAIKYSNAFKRDFEFYLRNLDLFSFSGKPAPVVPHSFTGPFARRCFHVYDSTGQMLPCQEPELLQKLLVCKASVNLNIKLWAQGIKHGVLCPPELGEFLESVDAPAWVLKSARRQGERMLCQSET